MCNYEMAKNSLWIVILDPLFSKQFRWLEPKSLMSDYLDWREKINSGSKISRQNTIVEFAMKYLERNFTELDQVICFPPSIHGSLDSNDKKIDAKYVSQLFTELFRKKLTKGIRAVLADYDVYEHATSLNYELEGYITPYNRVLIFYSELNMIFIVRVASSSDCINQESQNCSTDVKYFLCVNKPLIEEKALTVMGVVACPSVERKDLKDTLAFQFSSNFELFDVLLICKDELQSCKTLKQWWRHRFFEYCSNKKCHAIDETLFKQLIGLTMLVIAKDDDSLPTLESSTQKQIESMILNHEQILALGDNNLKKVITGGFGSGKSVFGKEIVKSFYMKASKPAILYYICCDHFSLFEYEMKRFVNYLEKNSNSNVTIICDNLFELWRSMCENQRRLEQVNISLPELLQYYGEKSSTTVNFVLNELSGEYIKEKDANQLKMLFSSRLKESLVVFIIQSTEKDRFIMIDGQEQIFKSNNNLSEEKLGMKHINFENSKRVTGSIQLVITDAQNTISKSHTVFDYVSNNLGHLEGSELNNNEPIENSFYDDDLDHAINVLSLNPNPPAEMQSFASNKYIRTQYSFKLVICKHKIEGVKPKLVFLPKISLVEESSAKILSVVLENLCFEKVRSTVVICSDMQELKLVAYAIDNIESYKAVVYSPHLQKNSPKSNEKEKVTELIKKSKLNVLVTDSRAMCGLESEAVIIFVKPEEYYLRHLIVDVCARSNSYLILLVLPSENRLPPSVETVNEVLKNWSEKDIVHQIRIKVVSNGKNDPLCTLTEGNLVINDQCNKFKTRRTKLNFPDYINKHFKTNSKSILT